VISVGRYHPLPGIAPDKCTASDNADHTTCPREAVFDFSIGGKESLLCERHALDTFNALGYMLASVTGKSIAALAGVRERKSKGKG
jgi:hypothetical protein